MRKIFAIIIIAIFGVLAWHYRFSAQQFIQELPEFSKNAEVSQIAQEIFAPPPLIGKQDNPNSSLTRVGVISWTNINRQQNGNLKALKENSQLDKAAQLKLADMFKQQYFEHENPQGVGPGDLAKQASYNFIAVGENLALGNFTDDQDLVTAWMNSPGHRANILYARYEEIGVAVGKGMYQGRQTWLAVQEFGKPASSCPSVDSNLKQGLEDLKTEIDRLRPELEQLKTQMDSAKPKTQSEYEAYNNQVAQYNSMVKIYNNKVDSLKLLTGQYNNQVKDYNACIGS